MASGTGVDGRPRMVDVGRLANVSAQTVSRYFTGGYVGADARARIERAVATLGYRPHGAARRLKSNRSDAIGLIATGPTNFGIWSMLEGLNEGVRRAGFTLVIGQLDIEAGSPRSQSELRMAVDQLLRAGVDGVIFSTPYPENDVPIGEILAGVPLVVVSETARSGVDSVRIDSYTAARLATGHLLELGHRRVLHLGGEDVTAESQAREHGYVDAMRAAGAEPLPVRHIDWTADAGYRLGVDADPTQFTAVFAANDAIASGFMSAMRSRGLTAPDDYSIVGIDDMPEARFYAPPLTTVNLGFSELGDAAVEMLLEIIRTGEHPHQRTFAPHLVVRESASAPR